MLYLSKICPNSRFSQVRERYDEAECIVDEGCESGVVRKVDDDVVLTKKCVVWMLLMMMSLRVLRIKRVGGFFCKENKMSARVSGFKVNDKQ